MALIYWQGKQASQYILYSSSSWLGILLSSAEFVLFALGLACYSVALLPYLTDQMIGASSDELSAVVRWYFWAYNVGSCLNASVKYNQSMSSVHGLVAQPFFQCC